MARDPNDPGTRNIPGLGTTRGAPRTRASKEKSKERNRLHQQEFKARQRAKNLKFKAYWASPAQHREIQRLLADPTKEKLSRTQRYQRNLAIVQENIADVRARRAAGEAPTAVATWLREVHGFEGDGATLNHYI